MSSGAFQDIVIDVDDIDTAFILFGGLGNAPHNSFNVGDRSEAPAAL